MSAEPEIQPEPVLLSKPPPLELEADAPAEAEAEKLASDVEPEIQLDDDIPIVEAEPVFTGKHLRHSIERVRRSERRRAQREIEKARTEAYADGAAAAIAETLQQLNILVPRVGDFSNGR